MRRTKKKIDSFQSIHFPPDYFNFTEEEKKDFCLNLIDVLLFQIDKNINPELNRITFLNDIFDLTLQSNEQDELYESCAIIKDCKKHLNDN